jgi:hypothetical protein
MLTCARPVQYLQMAGRVIAREKQNSPFFLVALVVISLSSLFFFIYSVIAVTVPNPFHITGPPVLVCTLAKKLATALTLICLLAYEYHTLCASFAINATSNLVPPWLSHVHVALSAGTIIASIISSIMQYALDALVYGAITLFFFPVSNAVCVAAYWFYSYTILSVLDLSERTRSASSQASAAAASSESASEQNTTCCECISSMSALAMLRTRLVLISVISIAVISLQLSSGFAAVSPAQRSKTFLPFAADGVEDMLNVAQLVANLFGVWLFWVPLGVCGMNPPPAADASGTLIRAGSLSSTASWRQKSLSRTSSLESRRKPSKSDFEFEPEPPAVAANMDVVLEMTESFAATTAHTGASDTPVPAPAPAPACAREGDSAVSATDETAQNAVPSVPV